MSNLTLRALIFCITNIVVYKVYTISVNTHGDHSSAGTETEGHLHQQQEANQHGHDQFKCYLYMAPSSIPNSGFGVYTTRDIKKFGTVSPTPDAPSVIITDIEAHTDTHLGDFYTHVDYFWSGSGLGEFEGTSASENVFTLGCLSNFHTALKNLNVSVIHEF